MDAYRKSGLIRTSAILTNLYVTTESIHCLPYDYFTLLLEYGRGAADGAVSFYPEFSLTGGVSDWWRMGALEQDDIVVNTNADVMLQRAIYEYGGTANTHERVVFGPFPINQFAKFIRFAFTETGNVGSPGICGAYLVLTRGKQKM
jgi:hypothetical protein